ncbi:unnamed protein product [Rhizopus stolonifer]
MVYTIPMQQEIIQQARYPEIKQIPANNFYSALDRLDKDYSEIINRIFDSNLNELFESVPETFLTIHELQAYGKDYCQTSLFNFVQVLEAELEKSRNNLLISIRPLLEIKNSPVDLFNPDQVATNVIKQLYVSDMTVLDRIIRLFKSSSFRLRMYHENKEASALKAWLHSWLVDIKFALNQEFATL